jgi:thiamine-phosphate diphosphorylase
VAAAAFAGGADVVQLRDKTRSPEALVREGRLLVALARRVGKLLVVNDHLELALAVRADGLHVGPDDLPVDEARRLWPRPAILGGSARHPLRAREVVAAGADYLGVGPVFGTTSKADAPGALGLDGLAAVVEAVEVPVIGIGGIDAGNAREVLRAGAAGVAVLSSVVGAVDVEGATRALRRALDAT